MINELNAIGYCSEDISLIDNYKEACADTTQTWICHHKKEISENKSSEELIRSHKYFQVPASDLIFLTETQHKAIHRCLFVYFNGTYIWLKTACKELGIYYTSVLHRMRRKNQSAQEAFDAIRFGKKRIFTS